MKIFESEYLLIDWDENQQIITEEWQLYFGETIQEAIFRQPMELILKTVKEKKISKLLINSTERKPLRSADLRWMEEYFYPELANSGIKALALLNQKNLLSTTSAKNMMRQINEKVEVKVFNEMVAAKTWLGQF